MIFKKLLKNDFQKIIKNDFDNEKNNVDLFALKRRVFCAQM
jgi:hypothetical protein